MPALRSWPDPRGSQNSVYRHRIDRAIKSARGTGSRGWKFLKHGDTESTENWGRYPLCVLSALCGEIDRRWNPTEQATGDITRWCSVELEACTGRGRQRPSHVHNRDAIDRSWKLSVRASVMDRVDRVGLGQRTLVITAIARKIYHHQSAARDLPCITLFVAGAAFTARSTGKPEPSVPGPVRPSNQIGAGYGHQRLEVFETRRTQRARKTCSCQLCLQRLMC